MTTVELEIELENGYGELYDELCDETETPVDQILNQNMAGPLENMMHKLYQEAKHGGE